MIKKYRNIILVFVVLIISTLGALIYLNQGVFDFGNLKNTAEKEFVGKYVKMGDFTDITRWDKTEKEFVLTKYDLIKPVYTYITHYGDFQNPRLTKENSKQFQILVVYYERTGLNTWKLLDYNQNTIRNTSWNKAIKSAKERDLSKIDSYNDQIIDHLKPLNSAEIEEGRKSQEQKIESNKILNEFDKKSNQEKYSSCLQGIKDLTAEQEALKQGKTELNGKPLQTQQFYEIFFSSDLINCDKWLI
jgi:hypothetical protein